jgi:hypothetical protein
VSSVRHGAALVQGYLVSLYFIGVLVQFFLVGVGLFGMKAGSNIDNAKSLGASRLRLHPGGLRRRSAPHRDAHRLAEAARAQGRALHPALPAGSPAGGLSQPRVSTTSTSRCSTPWSHSSSSGSLAGSLRPPGWRRVPVGRSLCRQPRRSDDGAHSHHATGDHDETSTECAAEAKLARERGEASTFGTAGFHSSLTIC